jgi:hypothetical protein
VLKNGDSCAEVLTPFAQKTRNHTDACGERQEPRCEYLIWAIPKRRAGHRLSPGRVMLALPAVQLPRESQDNGGRMLLKILAVCAIVFFLF